MIVGSVLHNLEWFIGDADTADDHPEPVQLQDCRKDQDEELIEINIAGEENRLSPFLSKILLAR